MGSGGSRSRFLSAYYIINVLVITSYALVHYWFFEKSDLKHSRLNVKYELMVRERQALSLLFVSTLIKFFRMQSLDAFFSDFFTVAKGVVAILAFYADIRIFIYYLILYVLLLLTCPQPYFKGPSRMEDFTPASFAEIVEERTDSDVTWLVNFFAPWAPQCLYLEPVIAELSLKYSTEKFRFGKIDVSRWPALANRYKISIRGEMGNQLPTLILFEKGKENGRIPHVYSNGKVAAGKFRRGDIVTAFALDERLEGKKVGSSSSGKKKNGGNEKKKNK